MKRIFLAVPVFFLAVGFCWAASRFKAEKIWMTGMKDHKAGRYEECVKNMSTAMEMFQEILNNPRQAKHHVGVHGGLAYTHTGRARCRWELGQRQEAIPDMEKGIDMLNHRCRTVKIQRKRECETVANDTETLAKWKKELGIKEEVKP